MYSPQWRKFDTSVFHDKPVPDWKGWRLTCTCFHGQAFSPKRADTLCVPSRTGITFNSSCFKMLLNKGPFKNAICAYTACSGGFTTDPTGSLVVRLGDNVLITNAVFQIQPYCKAFIWWNGKSWSVLSTLHLCNTDTAIQMQYSGLCVQVDLPRPEISHPFDWPVPTFQFTCSRLLPAVVIYWHVGELFLIQASVWCYLLPVGSRSDVFLLSSFIDLSKNCL